jgi:hypothetical protein
VLWKNEVTGIHHLPYHAIPRSVLPGTAIEILDLLRGEETGAKVLI